VRVVYEPTMGGYESEVVVPGIGVWGFAPDSSLSTLPGGRVTREYTGGTFLQLEEGMRLTFPVQIDLVARGWQDVEVMGRIARQFLAGRELWVNGRKHDFVFTGGAEDTVPEDDTAAVYTVTYTFDVEVREALAHSLGEWSKTNLDITASGV
jgi:hypothetical protein